MLSIEGIARESLWLSRQGDDLVIDVLAGSTDAITIQDWYASPDQQLDEIQAGGSALYAGAVDNLVNAMAAFGAPAGGEIELTPAQRDEVNAAIAANWPSEGQGTPGLTSWALSDSLASFHLSGSDTAEIGGDLADHYGRNGILADTSVTAGPGILWGAVHAHLGRPEAVHEPSSLR